jgi:hypothetical protein
MTVQKLTEEQKKKKVEALSNSRDLYAWRISDYPEVKSVLNYIFDEMKSETRIGKRYAKKYRDHIRVIVLDLFVAKQNDPALYITCSKNSNDYRPGTKYHRMYLSYEITNKIIKFLIKNLYIEHIRGYYRKKRPYDSKKLRMRAGKKLIQLLEGENKVELGMIQWDETEPVLILRDDEKREIKDYPEDSNVIQMNENLKAINRNMQNHAILLYVTDAELMKLNERLNRDAQKSPIDFTQKRLTRVFNGSFKKGGRFYGGWWQNIPREYRKYIRIDDKDVVECDFSRLHINMLYAKEGLPLPEEDPYQIDGYGNIREFLKQVLLRFVNANSRTSVIRSIKDRRNPADVAFQRKVDRFRE